MILFAAKIAASDVNLFFSAVYAVLTYNIFELARQPQKLPLLFGGSEPHLIHGSLGHPSQPPNSISIDSATFGAHEREQQTDRHTYRLITLLHPKQQATSYAIHAMWPKSNDRTTNL